jgi:hypothetical protein
MILIAHRGNLNGPNPEHENKPEYLLNAINKGYNVETDLWLIDKKLYLASEFSEKKPLEPIASSVNLSLNFEENL